MASAMKRFVLGVMIFLVLCFVLPLLPIPSATDTYTSSMRPLGSPVPPATERNKTYGDLGTQGADSVMQNTSNLEDPSPGYYETSEYLIGSVGLGIILPESNGTIMPSTEDWNTRFEKPRVISEIETALNWWASQNPSAGVSFTYEFHYRVPTSYEPINLHSYPDEYLWICEVMENLGYSGDKWTQTRNYVNDLRDELDTDWAFIIFVVDSSNDTDGSFRDGYFAYAHLGGPYLVMTYDNNHWGIDNMDHVCAHEMGHIFYATDEYNDETEWSGYLNVSDVDWSGCLMGWLMNWSLSGAPHGLNGTWGQVGWRDSDSDGRQDIVDTFPETFLDQYSPDPTSNNTLTYTGTATVVPFPNKNPYPSLPGFSEPISRVPRNITINRIKAVEYRIDHGDWMNATPTDGAFDEAVENFTFTKSSLSLGTHIIEARATNDVGNIGSPSNDTVCVAMVGDVDGDGDVDGFDLTRVCKAYGSSPEKPNWDPSCDFNKDHKVEVLDLFDLGKNYGYTA